jgi:NAD-dependent DNA ligase
MDNELDSLRKYPSVNHRIEKRSIDELIGICEGIIADKTIVIDEAKYLLDWIKIAKENIEDPVFRVLASRLTNMLADGILHEEEQSELLEFLKNFVGNTTGTGYKAPSSIPFDDPSPDVIIEESIFVFTGLMTFAPRADCIKIVEELGGTTSNNVTKNTNYLVVGNIASEYWKHSTHGLKIIKAMEYRDDRGYRLAIISEDHWLKFALLPSK